MNELLLSRTSNQPMDTNSPLYADEHNNPRGHLYSHGNEVCGEINRKEQEYSQTSQVNSLDSLNESWISADIPGLHINLNHLRNYLNQLAVQEIGMPTYCSVLTRDMAADGARNVIYPISDDVLVHVYPGKGGESDCYVPIEPQPSAVSPHLAELVDMSLASHVEELERLAKADDKKQALLDCLDRICYGPKGVININHIDCEEDDIQTLKYLMCRDKLGLGPVQPLIQDPYVEDISCSGVGSVFIEHRIFGGLKSSVAFHDNRSLDDFVIGLSEKIGKPATVRNPVIDASLPDGSRINIVYGTDISKNGSNFTIRRFSDTPLSILDLIDSGTLSYDMAAYLFFMISEGMNTFVSGETASGKTTFLNAISTFIPSSAKIVSIEDTPELQVPHENWIREIVRESGNDGSNVSMFDLLKAALRQRPDEIIVGEIRGHEGSVVFQAMQTGHPCMATFHASSVEKLIQRLTGNPINIPKPYIDNLNVVVVMNAVRLPGGNTVRRVTSINELIGFDPDSNAFSYIEVFRWDPLTDSFEFPGNMNTDLFENKVALKRGIPAHQKLLIYQKLSDLANSLKTIHERGIQGFYELHGVLTRARREGYIG